MVHLDQYIEYQARQMILQIVLPVLILCGTGGNITSLIVLLKPEQRCLPIARMLAVLAFSDLFTLWGVGLYNWILATFDIDIRDSSMFLCKSYSYVFLFLSYTSAVCIGAITLNRFIAVILPFKAKSIITIRNTNILLACVIIVSILANCHTLFGYGLSENGHCAQVEEIYSNLIVKICVLVQLLLYQTTIGFVIFANICIIGRLVYRQRHFRKQFTSTSWSAPKTTQKTTQTLLLVNIVYLICNIPMAAFGAKYRERPLEHGADNEADHDDALVLLFWAISVAAFLFNRAVNFVLYFISASKFRKEVKKLFK